MVLTKTSRAIWILSQDAMYHVAISACRPQERGYFQSYNKLRTSIPHWIQMDRRRNGQPKRKDEILHT